MKKLVMSAMALVLVALTSSAASISWGTSGSGVSIASATGVGLPTGYDVLLVWDTTGDGLGLTKDIDSGVVSFGTNITPIDTTRAIGASAGRTGTFTQDYATLDWNSTYSLYIVAFDGTDWTQASNFAAASKSVTLPAAITVVPQGSFLLATSGQKIVSGDWGAVETVPEPASLALLAVGAAAVVLRRRMLRK